jgi:hypothetical protein
MAENVVEDTAEIRGEIIHVGTAAFGCPVERRSISEAGNLSHNLRDDSSR